MSRKIKLCFVIIAAFILFLACGKSGGGAVTMVETDLSSNGIPFKVNIPEKSKITTEGMFIEKGAGISNKKFIMDINLYEEYADDSGDVATIVANSLDEVKGEEDFSEVILSETAGYIYSTLDGDNKKDFHFLYVYLIGDKEYHFSDGLSLFSNFTEEEAKKMYDSAKAATKL